MIPGDCTSILCAIFLLTYLSIEKENKCLLLKISHNLKQKGNMT